MSEQTQLTLVQQTITVPGCQLNMRGLTVSDGVSTGQLLKVGSHLGAVSGVLRWAWADYLATLSDRTCRGEDDSESLARYCDEHAIPAKTKREYLLMARFYPQEARIYPLPYEYYREAFMGGHGNKSRAMEYLAYANDEGISIGKFRSFIRKEEAGVVVTQRQSVFRDYTIVFDFAKFARTQMETEVETYDKKRATAVLTDLSDAVKFIERLQKIASSCDAINIK